ncbi:Sensor histidine kinase ComP [compost metagenome]
MKKFAFFLLIIIYSCSEKKISNTIITNDSYEKAWQYLDDDKKIDAFIEFAKAKDVFVKNKDSFSAGKCLINIATILNDKGDNFGSIEVSLEAIKYFNEKDTKQFYHILSNYNNLGFANYNLKNYQNALSFYNKGIYFAKDSVTKQISFNNKANAFRELKEYKNALKIYDRILKSSQENKKEYARALNNRASTLWRQSPRYNPIPEFKKALNIREAEKDNWGLNSSYAHLADYYIKNQKDSALVYARKMFSVAKEIKSPDDQIEALQKLISLEDANNSKQYFKVYQKLNDSLQTARNKAKNQFALIRYETEKNKADFLKAQAESSERQNHIIKQYVVLVFALITIIGFILYLKKRKKIYQQEKLLEVKNTELKYSKKVHDRVANRIYQILSQVENKEHIDRDSLLFSLENVYETTRDISYENEEINENQNYFEHLENMLDSYTSDSVQVIFNGNNEKLWEGINFQIKTEVYLILQELMTNMKKHSQADKVFLKFTNENSTINISYTDNGVGIQNHSPKNGLQNMENRINSINGKINFDTETKNLLKINISFPI